MEIGKKKLRKDGSAVDLWGEYGKRFTNGHKQFTSDQVKAVNELQSHEDRYRDNFKRLRNIMTKPRDPLAGDATPRTANGDILLNPNDHGANIRGFPLFEKDHEKTIKIKSPAKLVTGQIGVPDHKYKILGNKEEDIMRASAQPDDLFKKAQEDQARKSGQRKDADDLAASKMEVKAKRQAVKLAQTLAKMKIDMEKKTQELDFLETQQYKTMRR
jgi:hypothetical protein